MKSLRKYMNRFDYPKRQIGPQVGVVIICLLSFGVLNIVGLHPNEAQIGDLTIKLSNNFITNFMQKQDMQWNKRLVIDNRTLEIVPFHFLPFIE